MNDIAILHKAVNNNSNAGSTGMVFEGVMTEQDTIALVNENDVPIIVDAIKKGIYCSLHITNNEFEVYFGPIFYEGTVSDFALVITTDKGSTIIYTSDLNSFS